MWKPAVGRLHVMTMRLRIQGNCQVGKYSVQFIDSSLGEGVIVRSKVDHYSELQDQRLIEYIVGSHPVADSPQLKKYHNFYYQNGNENSTVYVVGAKDDFARRIKL